MKSSQEEELEEYEEVYRMFDSANEGKITRSQIMDILNKLKLDPSEPELCEMLKEISGSTEEISHDDFMRLLKKKKDESDQEQEIINAFRIFDKDGTGLISQEDLKMIMKVLGGNIDDKGIDDMIYEADVDGDGYINYEEFVRMMMAR